MLQKSLDKEKNSNISFQKFIPIKPKLDNYKTRQN